MDHSACLNAMFCQKHWRRFQRGEPHKAADERPAPPWWLDLMLVVPVKYVVVVLAAVLIGAWFRFGLPWR